MVINNGRRTFLKAMPAVGSISALAGCAGSLSTNEYEPAIGMPTPQSGPLASAGKAGLRGARVAAEEANADRDERVDLVEKDGQGSPAEARRVVQQMIDDGVPVITGTFSSDVSNALSDLAESEEVPFVTAISVDPAITDESDDYTFRLTGDTDQKLAGLSQFLAERNVEGLGIVGADYSMGRSAVEFMTENAGEYGFSVEHSSLVPLTTNNFAPELEKLDTAALDALFLPFPGGNGPTLVEQARQRGVLDEVELVVGHDSYGSQLYRQALGEKIRGVHNWGVDLSNERAKQASKTMQDEYGVPMDALSLPNYDAVHAILDAVEEGGSFAPQDVRDGLANVEYDAAAGWPVEFTESGDNRTYRMLVSQWQQSGDGLRNVLQFESDVVEP